VGTPYWKHPMSDYIGSQEEIIKGGNPIVNKY